MGFLVSAVRPVPKRDRTSPRLGQDRVCPRSGRPDRRPCTDRHNAPSPGLRPMVRRVSVQTASVRSTLGQRPRSRPERVTQRTSCLSTVRQTRPRTPLYGSSGVTSASAYAVNGPFEIVHVQERIVLSDGNAAVRARRFQSPLRCGWLRLRQQRNDEHHGGGRHRERDQAQQVLLALPSGLIPAPEGVPTILVLPHGPRG